MLESIWFFLWGLLWAVFFITDGFDFGVGALYPFIGKTDGEKKIMMGSLGPIWDGNEVWLITAGGVTFAAFPLVYAVMFSSLYSALMLILFCLIIRGVSFEFRNQLTDPKWLKFWDTCFFLGSALPALLFGVAFANIFMGIPIDKDGVYHGSLFTLLNPYGLLGGVLFLVLFIQHGALWLGMKTEGDLHERAAGVAGKIWPVVLVFAVIFLVASKFYTNLYDNYFANPVLFLILVVTVVALVLVKLFAAKEAFLKAWIASATTIAGATFYGVAGLFPNLFPSSMDPAASLTINNASSSPLTLKIMLTVVVIFIPIVIGYQLWTYRLFAGKITEQDALYDHD